MITIRKISTNKRAVTPPTTPPTIAANGTVDDDSIIPVIKNQF